LCQVSGRLREAGAVDVAVDVAGDGLQGSPEFGWRLGLVGGNQRDQEPVVELGVEDGDANAVRASTYRLAYSMRRMRP
jgi:hypothetical protein